MNRPILLVAAFAALAGCGPGAAPESELSSGTSALEVAPDPDGALQDLNGTQVDLAVPVPGGCEFAGAATSINGGPLPYGCSNNGPLLSSGLAYVRLDGVTMKDGSAASGVTLAGTQLQGTVSGAPVSDEDFEGARFSGTSTSGGVVLLRLEHVNPGHHQSDISRYEFKYQSAKGDWKPLCKENHDAVIVSGRWDYHQGTAGDAAKTNDPTVFTIGCRRSAIEKCIDGGYKPWVTVNGVSLDPYHQACVRMIRADYCGDGVSHTTPGRPINVWDTLGIQQDSKDWLMEAEWMTSGARCLSSLNLTPLDAPCLSSLGTMTCGDAATFAPTTLLVSETPKAGGRDGKLNE